MYAAPWFIPADCWHIEYVQISDYNRTEGTRAKRTSRFGISSRYATPTVVQRHIANNLIQQVCELFSPSQLSKWGSLQVEPMWSFSEAGYASVMRLQMCCFIRMRTQRFAMLSRHRCLH